MNNQTETVTTVMEPKELTMEWIMQRIDMVIKDTEYIKQAVEEIDEKNGQALGYLVEARENTNQQTLRLLEKMYDDLKPLRPNIDTIMDEATALPPNML